MMIAGSSPRERGTLNYRCRRYARFRFIPARAGNTPQPRRRTTMIPVHPRARGEHHFVQQLHDLAAGSSPRARGTHPARCSGAYCGRFIPARAGNTRTSAIASANSPVHPRARGEHGQVSRGSLCRFGSSPRARGTLCGEGGGPGKLRFIPARAGNTWARGRNDAGTAVHPRASGEHTSSNVLIHIQKSTARNSTDFSGRFAGQSVHIVKEQFCHPAAESSRVLRRRFPRESVDSGPG